MKNKYFLKWWLMVCLIVVGIGFLVIYDVVTLVGQYDITKISFLISGLFCYFTIKIGIETYKPGKNTYKNMKTADFFAGKFFVLGMIGTVLGFIYMLYTCFNKLDVSNPALMQAALMQMSVGMSTALFTTAAGLICMLLLKLQLFNLEQALEEGSEK
jgi:hypothetical protein